MLEHQAAPLKGLRARKLLMADGRDRVREVGIRDPADLASYRNLDDSLNLVFDMDGGEKKLVCGSDFDQEDLVSTAGLLIVRWSRNVGAAPGK